MKKDRKLYKYFGLSSWAIDNWNTVYVIIFIILVGGIFSYVSMPRESFPEVQEPTIYVSSIYPGNAAEDVEKFITKPLENEIKNISGIKEISSFSIQDYSLIKIKFEEDILIEIAKQNVKDKVDIAQGASDWPTIDGGVKVDPYAFDLNLTEIIPIMNINLTGDYPDKILKHYAEELEDLIENIPEVKAVDIRGVQDMEVEIAVDIYKMMASNITIQDIINAIRKENVTISGGNIIANNQRRNIRVVGTLNSPKEFNDIVIKNKGGVVYLRNVAEVKFRPKDRTSYAREYLKPVVMLDVKKRSGSNELKASEKIYKLIEESDNILPDDININITSDNSEKTQQRVANLENNIVFGIILIVLVLMFFLGFINSLFVGLVIPLSMLMSFIILSAMGVTLNTMTLFALVMGLGMLVDNGIVVVENVYRLMGEGMTRKEAAKQGMGEIAWPIISSTATTLAAFLPLGLWPGIIGDFMIYFPLTISVVLSSSLFVALIINAMITSRFMQKEDHIMPLRKTLIFGGVMFLFGIILLVWGILSYIKTIIGIGNILIVISVLIVCYRLFLFRWSSFFQYSVLPRAERFYERFLRFALKGKNAYIFFIGTVFLLFIALILFALRQPKILFFPNNQPNSVVVYIKYPEGTDIEKVNITTENIEKKIISILDKYNVKQNDGSVYNYMVESIISQVGEGAGNPQVDGGSKAGMANKGKVVVLFRNYKYRRGVKSSEVLTDIRRAVKGYIGASVIVDKNHVGPPSGYPINLELKGYNYKQLIKVANNIKEYFEEKIIPGVEKIHIDVNEDKPERKIIIDRAKAGDLGLSVAQIGRALRNAIYGYDASTFKDDKYDYDIMVRFNKKTRYNMSALLNQEIIFRTQSGELRKVPISSVVTIKDVSTFSSIKRKDMKRVISLYSNVLEGYNANEIVQQMIRYLSSYDFPREVYYKFTGEQKDMKENMDFLYRALLIALSLITLIIVAQFNSISKPIIILMSVILSFIGVFFGMILSGSEFVITMTMMGVISLAGIVVNNAIVLIDYTQLLIDRHKASLKIRKEDLLDKNDYYNIIVKGGISRLRPVLLTAITTVLGLIPLAIGLNINFISLMTDYDPQFIMGGDNTAFWGPLAWTIINGLTFATFLTLIIVPVMFYLVNRIKIRIRERRRNTKAKPA